MANLSLSLLSPFSATLGDVPLPAFRTLKVKALLIYLAIEKQTPQPREALMCLLWPDLPERSARTNLRQVIFYLRRMIPSVQTIEDVHPVEFLLAENHQVQINPAYPCQVDVHVFNQLLEKAHTHDHLDLLTCPECQGRLRKAVALYRGDFLADFYLDDSNEYEEWAEVIRTELRGRALDALEALASVHLQKKDYRQARRYAERQLQIDDLRESAYCQLMEALALGGQRTEALTQYEICRRRLAEELSMAPTSRTTALYETIRSSELELQPQAGVRGYELKEEIGRGAFGAVHRAIQPAIGREVAIKIIRPEYANDPEFMRGFEAEAQIVARLEHPHIVPLYDYWRAPEGAYLVMRLFRRGSLQEALQKGPWEAGRAVKMIEQVATALSAIHSQGVIHRDLKPANILLDESGNAYLSDFGIAVVSGREGLGKEISSPTAYLSPEQLLDEPLTPQANLYSLGMILYETLSGEKPYSGASLDGLIRKHLEEPLPPLSAKRPDLPPEVDAILRRATAKRAVERYPDVLSFAADLRKALLGASRTADVVDRTTQAAALVPELMHVPLPETRLIGRQVELSEIYAHLQDAETHLLTLSGPAGVGKTRLAVAAVWQAQQGFPDGVYFIDLAPLSRGDLILQALTSTLGISQSSNLEQTLLSALRRQCLLLLMDNCEHLVEACAQLIYLIITSCPQVKVLATSRHPLEVPGERVYPLSPLPVPDLQAKIELPALAQNAAVSLFNERARARRDDFALNETNARSVGEICIHLDGLPLAIELAAARVNVLSPAQIATRLDDRLRLLTRGSRSQHAHQQTLRTALDWSHALLTPGERVLFRRLANFDGSFSLEAAESACADQELIAEEEVLDLLACLIDHSLVKAEAGGEEMRYRLLETMRQYAGERLAASGEEREFQLRHIAHYRSLVAQAEPHFYHADEVTWLDRLELEVDNLRGALEHALSLDPPSGAKIAVSLGRFWHARGYQLRGLHWTKRYLEMLGDTLDELQIKTALCYWAATYAANLQRLSEGRELAKRGLDLAYSLQDPRWIAYALDCYALASYGLEDKAYPALEALQTALELFRQVGDDWGAARCLERLAYVYEGLSERGLATRYCMESLQKYRQIGDQVGVGRVFFRLGFLAKRYGDLEAAKAYFEESLAITRQIRDRFMIAFNLLGLGEVTYRQGNYIEAQQCFKECNYLNSKTGNREVEVGIQCAMGNIKRLEGNYGEASEKLSHALALSQDYGLIFYIRLALLYLGKLECNLENYRQAGLWLEQALLTSPYTDAYKERYLEILDAITLLASEVQMDNQAAQLLGAVEACRERQELRRYPVEVAEIEPLRQSLQERLGEEGFAEAYAQGRSLTLEEAVKVAQEMLAALKSAEAE